MTALEREEGKQSHLQLPVARTRGPGALRPVRAARAAGKAGGGRRCASHAAPSRLRQPLIVPVPATQGSDERRGARAERSRRAPQRLFPPHAAAGWLCARLCAGIFLRSPRHSALLRRLRAAAHPGLTPRPPRDPPIVSSQQRRRGRAKPCHPPALGRAQGVRALLGSRRSSAAPARRVPERHRRARPAAAGSPGVAREPRTGLSASPHLAAPHRLARPSSRRHLPPAPQARCPPHPLSPGPRRAKGPGRSPPAALAALPLDVLAASARTCLRGARRGAYCTSGTRAGRRREDGQDSQTLASWTFLRKVRESGAGAAEQRTNPEAAVDPELLSCDAEGQRILKGATEEGGDPPRLCTQDSS
ncbi:uncharacterized protein V5649_007175 [Rhynchonycteris naso]